MTKEAECFVGNNGKTHVFWGQDTKGRPMALCGELPPEMAKQGLGKPSCWRCARLWQAEVEGTR